MPKVIVFTKPWPDTSLEALADTVAALGLDGVELTVRDGYQVAPGEGVEAALTEAARIFAERGLSIPSIAADPDPRTVAACGAAGVGVLRFCARVDMGLGYHASVARHQRQMEELVPLLEDAGTALGVQNHANDFVGSAIGLHQMLQPFEPRHAFAVLDFAHCAMDGEPVDMAVNIVRPYLTRLVNFKSAIRMRTNGPEEIARYRIHWSTHQHSTYDWGEAVSALQQVGYAGDYCLPAEYTHPSGQGHRMGDEVLACLRDDLARIRALLG